MLDDEGHDIVRARFMHALAQLPLDTIQIVSVNASDADTGPNAEPDDWGDSSVRQPTGDDHVERG
eukprot:1139112-Pyramimonas_sp.AAC.1